VNWQQSIMSASEWIGR